MMNRILALPATLLSQRRSLSLPAWINLAVAGVVPVLSAPQRVSAEEKKPAEEKVTFADHVLPIFRQRCGSCHNANDKRGGLAVDNYTALMSGGSSGDVIESGDSGNSYLFSLITHASEPKMPPNADKLPANELAIIEKWINQGAPENSGSTVMVKKKASLAKVEVSNERPQDVAMPARYYGDPSIVPERANAVTALANSPWTSLAALSGHRQVTLFNPVTLEWFGVLPYPEGQPQVVKFSRDGSLLMVGGGRGGQSGRVVVYDVRTGERKIEVGDEYDEILAADISPDLSLIALGGPKKMLRVYSTESGELISENKKHTDWITAIEFSPDGVLFASGDRSNGLFVWESNTGAQFYDLQGHKGAVTDISWRLDSNLMASSSEDKTIKLWEMQNGTQAKSWDAHNGGTTALEYTRDGNIVSVGRDQAGRIWNGDGGKIRDLNGLSDLGMEIAYDAESKRVLVGDWTGKVTIFNAEDGQIVGVVNTNPPTVPMQVTTTRQQIDSLKGTLAVHQKTAGDLRAKLTARQQAATQAAAVVVQATEGSTKAVAKKQEVEKAIQGQQGVVAAADAKLKTAQATLATAMGQFKDLQAALVKGQADLKGATDRQTQAAAVVATATQALTDARAKSEELAKAAEPTPEEAEKLEADPQVKQAVADRKAAAEAAVQVVTQAETALAAANAGLQKAQGELAAANDVANKAAEGAKAGEAAQATANAGVQQSQQELAAAQKTLADLQPQLTAAQQAEQVAAKAVADAQAAAKAAADAAPATPEEQKVLGDNDAAAKAAQDQIAGLEGRLKQLQDIQSAQTTSL